MRFVACLLSLLLLTACARYEYDLVQPAELARRIGHRDEDAAIFTRDDLAYRLQAREDRLVMTISNPSDDVVELLGPESYVVDPNQQSRPVRPQAIAPHSYIRLILPPLHAYYAASPHVGVMIASDPWYPPPPYPPPLLLPVPDDPQYYWQWRGETPVRLRLAFARAGRAFHHEFTFHRRKT